MTSIELRRKFLEYFKSKGHQVIPSASVVPINDPTVLFTTAGMHPLVPNLLGQPHPKGKRLVSAQKCIRTGDIVEVGDDSHLTFFEMLGNWSLGDYFKQEAIAWSYEFLTSQQWLGLAPERLAFSCFAGDETAPRDSESAELWMSHGVKPERIVFLGKEDNWWGPAGQTGPCGPDTEMFYWTGAGEPPKNFDPSDKRWFEIWNDVFMQYNKTVDGRYEPLSQKNVDTGMGLERTLVALNGLKSVYETDLFVPLLAFLQRAAQVTNDQPKFRVIADHIKAACFMTADGVVPSNKDRGYVLRRLLRRSMVYAKFLELEPAWLKGLVNLIIDLYASIYPELQEQAADIIKVVEAERNKFMKTLEKGIKEVKSDIMRTGYVTGSQASTYYQTYGIPFEVTVDIVTTLGGDIKDPDQFKKAMARHQELSRSASSGVFKGGLADHTAEVVRLHTATHLMNAALRKVLGEHVWQKGSNITKERTRFDFTHTEKMTDEQKQQVEKLVNEWIERDLTVKRELMPLAEARKLGAIGVFGEKYADTVSVYTVYDPKNNEVISREFCGGPHVEHTGLIGRFKIIKEEAVAAGVRRIKACVSEKLD
jgi:alanyl-tRNA synthetase